MQDGFRVHELRCVKILKQMLQSAKILDKLNMVHNDIKLQNYFVKLVPKEIKLVSGEVEAKAEGETETEVKLFL